ncbi:MAG: VWA domain-containing protein [Pyrinomonadaceae bacterium]
MLILYLLPNLATKSEAVGIKAAHGFLNFFRFSSAFMKNSVLFLSLLTAFVFSFTLLASAQQKPGDDVIKAPDVFEVRLPVTVVDKKKQPISGLKKSDFVVLEDGKEQEVTFFTDESDNPPVYVGVMMDTSPSTAGKTKFSKEAAKNFLFTVMRVRKDKAAFLTFDHEIKLRQDFTDKTDLLGKAVDAVKEVGNKTSLYDAVYQFCDEKLRGAAGRRVIVLITDGDDTFSRADLNDAIDIAQRTETTVFAISTKAGFLASVPGVEAGTVRDTGDKDLVRLAKETGGQAFFTGDMLALEKSFGLISKQLRTQYYLTYKPANQNYDGVERKIEVRLADNGKDGDHKIFTKSGYRAVRDRIR